MSTIYIYIYVVIGLNICLVCPPWTYLAFSASSLQICSLSNQAIPPSFQWVFLQYWEVQSQSSSLLHLFVVSLQPVLLCCVFFLFNFFFAIPHWATAVQSRENGCRCGSQQTANSRDKERLGRSHAATRGCWTEQLTTNLPRRTVLREVSSQSPRWDEPGDTRTRSGRRHMKAEAERQKEMLRGSGQWTDEWNQTEDSCRCFLFRRQHTKRSDCRHTEERTEKRNQTELDLVKHN